MLDTRRRPAAPWSLALAVIALVAAACGGDPEPPRTSAGPGDEVSEPERAGPIGPALDRFLSAWESGETKAIAELTGDAGRTARIAAYIDRLRDANDWPSMPELEAPRLETLEGQVKMWFPMVDDDREIYIRWSDVKGEWLLRGLKVEES